MHLGIKWGMVKRGLQAEKKNNVLRSWGKKTGVTETKKEEKVWKGEKRKGNVGTDTGGEEDLNQTTLGP